MFSGCSLVWVTTHFQGIWRKLWIPHPQKCLHLQTLFTSLSQGSPISYPTKWNNLYGMKCNHGYYKLWIGNWTANQSSFLLFNLVDLVASATIAVSRYPKPYRNSLRDFFGYLKTAFYSGGLGVYCRHWSLGQNIVCTMSMEFQSPGVILSGTRSSSTLWIISTIGWWMKSHIWWVNSN